MDGGSPEADQQSRLETIRTWRGLRVQEGDNRPLCFLCSPYHHQHQHHQLQHLTTINTTVPPAAFNMPSTKFLSLLALAASAIAVRPLPLLPSPEPPQLTHHPTDPHLPRLPHPRLRHRRGAVGDRSRPRQARHGPRHHPAGRRRDHGASRPRVRGQAAQARRRRPAHVVARGALGPRGPRHRELRGASAVGRGEPAADLRRRAVPARAQRPDQPGNGVQARQLQL